MPEDAENRKRVIDESGAHLAAFFPPTVDGPMSLEAHVADLRMRRSWFDTEGHRVYFVREHGGDWVGEVMLLRRSGVSALEVGYWLTRAGTGRGLATEMTAALVKCAFEVDRVKRVDLLCSPANVKSAAIALRLGFVFEGTLRDRQLTAVHPRGDLLSYSLLEPEYRASAARELPVAYVDVLGRPIVP